MFRPLRATFNPAASAGPLLGPQHLHLSREAGSFLGQKLPAEVAESRRSDVCSWSRYGHPFAKPIWPMSAQNRPTKRAPGARFYPQAPGAAKNNIQSILIFIGLIWCRGE